MCLDLENIDKLFTGWPRTLENRENDEKKFPVWKKSGNLIKIRKSGKNQGNLPVLLKKS